MLLEKYLKVNKTNLRQFHIAAGIPETTVRNINKREMEKWTIAQFDAIASLVEKDRKTVINELEELRFHSQDQLNAQLEARYNLENRRYIGNKNKLLGWIKELIEVHTVGTSFFDVFAGTGVVAREMLDNYDHFIINDFLYSNQIIYEAFFGSGLYSAEKLNTIKDEFQSIKDRKIDDNYFEKNYGNRFFSKNDARIIGEIRTTIESIDNLTEHEHAILIASLLYSADKIANTVGHYDAYRKKVDIKDRFLFELILPMDVREKRIVIHREDSNVLASKVSADIAFIDPPYNSRQYSRFYHVLENLAKWDKPTLVGTARKPPAENISEYSKCSAPCIFDDLISNLNVKYIVVTYNNTYNPKSSSSKNKITHCEILETLNKVGKTEVFEKPFKCFNAGKTELKDHREFVFITEVEK